MMSASKTNVLSKNVVSTRFHVKDILKSWAENCDETAWKLFEQLSDFILINNITIFDSKYSNKFRFGILEVMREIDAQNLMNLLDDKDRFYISTDKFYITIRKFTELPLRSTINRIKYSRDEILLLRKLATIIPKIPINVYSLIRKKTK